MKKSIIIQMLAFILAVSTVSCAEVAWTQLPGQLKNIQVDGEYQFVCGTTINDQIYCSDTTNIAWYEAPGALNQVSVAKGQIFGVTRGNEIFYSPSATQGQISWTKLPGGLSQISFDGTTVCGTINNEIYCADENVTTNPNWFQLPGGLKEVVVRGQKLYGVSSDDQVWFSPSVRNAAWTKLSGALKQIQFDGSVLCGTTSNDEIFCANKDLETNPNWEKLSGGLSVVSVSLGGQMFGTSSNTNIYSGNFGSKSCVRASDCSAGLVCVNPGAYGICGNADANMDLLDVPAVEGHVDRGRVLITDNTAWTDGDTVPRKVVMAHLLAPLAEDSYNNPPTNVLGSWNALTPAIGADFSALFAKWGWLSFTVLKF